MKRVFSAVFFLALSPAWAEPEFPEDLGPAEIDVSGYPAEHQKTYREIFLSVFGFFGETARVVNSPVVEMGKRLEAAQRSENPFLFEEPGILKPTRGGWRKKITEMYQRPPCCGACPVLSLKQAKLLHQFLVYDSLVRKTGPNAQKWAAHRRRLIKRFQRKNTEAFQKWFEKLELSKEETGS